MSWVRVLSIGLLVAAVLPVQAPVQAADVEVSSGDGLTLVLESTSGAVNALRFDGVDYRDPNVNGGLFVRDRANLLTVPPAALNLVGNGSFEIDADLNGVPDGWEFEDGWTNNATLTLDPTRAADGIQSASIDRAGGRLTARYIPVQPGQRYLLQARVEGSGAGSVWVLWRDRSDNPLLYEYGGSRRRASWGPIELMMVAPQNAGSADVVVQTTADGATWLDHVQLTVATPEVFSLAGGAVVAIPEGARQTATLPGLGLDFTATYRGLAEHIEIDVTVTNTRGGDRALEAGFIAPVLPRRFWDHSRGSRQVTQQIDAETFAYTWWGGVYNDGPWGTDRSIYPFAAVSLGSAVGLAMGYDVQDGPLDAQLFHSTHIGESFTALVRVGLAPEPLLTPDQARFRLVLFRTEGADSFRSALERYQRLSPVFESRQPQTGGWLMWHDVASIAGPEDFGIVVHSWHGDPVDDEAAGVRTLAYQSSFDTWLTMGDYPTEPTAQDVLDRLDFNANDPGADPGLQQEARGTLVSALHDTAAVPRFDIVQVGWMPGSGWAAVCAVNPDPEVTDGTANLWPSRYQQRYDATVADFAAAASQGAPLDGVFFDWFSSWNSDLYNHRRRHFQTVDTPLSFDPDTLTPALPEPFAHWEMARAIGTEMRGLGLFTMARDINYPSFFATAELDLMGQEIEWDSGPPDHEQLGYYRTVAGRKPYMLQLNADFQTVDLPAALERALLHGLTLTPNWDNSADGYYWDQPGLADRDRALWRRFVGMWRLQDDAGWQPVTRASASDPSILLERWGTAAGPLLVSAWNDGTATIVAELTVDLPALSLAPAAVTRVVELVTGRMVATRVVGGRLAIDDTLASGVGRLYQVQMARPGSAVLYAVKRSADVELSWTDGGRTAYTLLSADRLDFGGARVDLVQATGATDSGVVSAPVSRFYSVD